MRKIIIVLVLFVAGCAGEQGRNWGELFRSYAEVQRDRSEVQFHTNPNYWQEENARQEINERFSRKIRGY